VRKLPAFSAFVHALKSTWNNLPFAFQVSWPWLLVLIPLRIWVDVNMVEFDPLNIKPEQLPAVQAAVLRMYASMFVSMIIYSSIGIMWHRYILKDEIPSGTQRIRMDGMVARYVGNTILIALLVMLSLLPFALLLSGVVAATGNVSTALFTAFFALVIMIAMPITYRLSIKLPAIALGRRDFDLKNAWQLTEGNMVPLMALSLLSIALVLVVGSGAGAVMQGLAYVTGGELEWAFMIVRQIISWIMAIFAITLLTSLYGFFVEKREF
jgi:hypothetical protein